MCGALIGTGLWHRSPASFPAAAVAEGLRAVSSRTLDDTVRVSGVRSLSKCEWNNGQKACFSRILGRVKYFPFPEITSFSDSVR